MEFTIEESGNVLVAHLKEVLDAKGVSDLHNRAADQLAHRDRRLVLDFREVYALDPMGLVELLKLSQWVKERGPRLRVAHAATHVEEALRDNMISDVDFFPNTEAACRYSEPAQVQPERPKEIPPPAPAPAPAPPREPVWRTLFRRYGWLMIIGVLLGFVASGTIFALYRLRSKELEFQDEKGVAWKDAITVADLKVGETRFLRFLVRNATNVGPIPNPDWIQMTKEKGGEKDTWNVVFELSPKEYFPPTTTYFKARTGDAERDQKSPTIQITCAEKIELPKFDITGRESENYGEGKEGYPLVAGIEGEAYGPDKITATGGGGLKYSASGHEPYGLQFDTFTGDFSGRSPKPTPGGGYVPIRITATNAHGNATITALLFIEKKKDVAVAPTPIQRANLFDAEIEKRFRLVDKTKLDPKDIQLLLNYKQIVAQKGDGDIHKLDTVFFPIGKANLDAGFRQKLDSEFESSGFREMAKRQDTFFFVLGFADKGTGNSAKNNELIHKRAKTLSDYLAKHLSEQYDLSREDLTNRVRTIPMQPVPDDKDGKPVIFDSRERSRAGEIWLVKDPR